MNCVKCGYKIESNAKYCVKCGTKNENQSFNEGAVDKYFKEKNKSLIQEAKVLAEDEMKQGVIWFVIGLVITGATWLFASDGGTYYVFWGAMLYGLYRLIRGFWYKLNPQSLLKKARSKME